MAEIGYGSSVVLFVSVAPCQTTNPALNWQPELLCRVRTLTMYSEVVQAILTSLYLEPAH